MRRSLPDQFPSPYSVGTFPKCSTTYSRQATFRPVTNFPKATNAAVFNRTNVNATSAVRVSRLDFKGIIASKLKL